MSKISRRRFLRTSAAALGAGLGAECLAEDLPNGAAGTTPGAPPAEAVSARPGAAAGTPPSPSPHKHPHIVLIILDTLRADKLSCYGYPHNVSPALDHLAEQGVRFERVISQCSWTRPSIGSLLTSKFARTLGLYKEQGEVLNEKFDTLPKILQRSGYRTLGATANPNINSIFNFHLGFDNYTDSNVLFPWMERKPGQKIKSIAAGLPAANDMFANILAQLKEPSDKPTYVQINAMEIHEWFVTRTMIRPQFRRMFFDTGERFTQYLQSIRQLTDDIGKFVAQVQAIPGFEDTMFVFLSDHGEGLDSHPNVHRSSYHGWLLYESQVVVPWIIYRKGWEPQQKVISQPVRLLEVMPTLLELAGLPPADDIEGVSVAGLISGAIAKAELPPYLVTETHWREADKSAAYDAEWKFFNHRTGLPVGIAMKELQARGNRENGQNTNQYHEQPEVSIELERYLEKWNEQYPKADPTPLREEISQEEKDQLEAIGYLGDGNEAPAPPDKKGKTD